MSEDILSKVKTLSKMQNKSLKEVAIEAGIGENSIYRWKTNPPRIESLMKVAKALNVDYQILLPNSK